MAEGGDMKSSFDKFSTDKLATCKQMTSWMTDAGVLTKKTCTSNNLDIAFSSVLSKNGIKNKKLEYKHMDAMIGAIAKKYGDDHKMSEEEGKAAIKAKLCACQGPKMKGVTKQSKTGGVDKMTDSSQYTGAHKERFGADGKGKGMEGRADVAENTGYTGQYKGKDTFDSKK